MSKFCTLWLVASLWCLPALAQEADTLAPAPHQLLKDGEGEKTKDPTRAVLLSAALPGLGQIYNKKYWKLPIVYGGAYALAWGIDWNNDNYNEVRSALFAVRNQQIDPLNPLHTLSEATLERETDRFRRDRDFLIIGSIVAYFIVMVDAYVDAHLKDFPLGKKRTALRIQPSIKQNFGQISSGLALNITF